jgi:hypothetical protein
MNKLSSLILLTESQKANDKEYFKAIEDYYHSDELIGHIRVGEDQAKHITGNSTINTEKTDNDNVIVRWIEGNDTIVVLGIVSKTGKIERKDVSDLKKWMALLSDKIEEGKTVYTSPNNLSKPILMKVIDNLKEKGLDISVEVFNSFSFNGITWEGFKIEKV